MVVPTIRHDLKDEAVMKDQFFTVKNVTPQERRKGALKGNNLLQKIIRLFGVETGTGKNRELIYDHYGSEIEKAWKNFEKGSKSN
jgi:hypothetical protein